MAAEPMVATNGAGADGEVHGRTVSSGCEAFSNHYIFFVDYVEIDPGDDAACMFLERIGVGAQPDGSWRFVRRQGNFEDTILKISSILLPGSETWRRLQILMRTPLDTLVLLSMIMKIVDESTAAEYVLYQDKVDVEAFGAAVSAILAG